MDDNHDEPTGRTTAPQSDFSFGEVQVGLLIFIVGALVAFGIPTLLL